ncbi:MAG: hypothetical protein GXP47_05040 [Acidobacteria bacterium]|nr:hypothetical protein [Acidobacteriota bacterium]
MAAEDSVSPKRAALSDEVVQRILVDYQAVDKRSDSGFVIHEVRVIPQSDGNVLYRIKTDRTIFLIDGKKRRVRAVTFRKAKILSRASDGRLISRSEFLSQFVKVSERDAEVAARKYVEEHFGYHILDGLQMTVTRKEYGSGFYYGVAWRNPPNANGVFLGTRLFDVSVSPIDGTVMAGVFVDEPIHSKPLLSITEAKTLGNKELESEGVLDCAVLQTIRVVGISTRPRAERLVWRLSYSLTPGCTGEEFRVARRRFVVFLDDASGKPLAAGR